VNELPPPAAVIFVNNYARTAKATVVNNLLVGAGTMR